jgi:trigger factor
MQLVSRETADDGRLTITVKAEPAEVGQAVDGVYRDLRRRANIPGFRKGKAPRALLEQQLAPDEAQRMALDDLAERAVIEGIKQAEIEPLTPPKLEKAEVEGDGSATFVAAMVPRPKVELGEYRGLSATRPTVEVTDEQVEAQLYQTRERYAGYEPVADRPAQVGDLALVDYDLMIEGQVVEEQSTHGYPCQIGSDTLFPELNDKLPGLKPGEQVRIAASFRADHRDPALAGKLGEYVATLRELKVRVVPELTDDMAKDAHGVESVEALRQVVRRILERLAAEEAEDRVRRDLVEQVMAGSRVTVPPALARQEAQARLDQLETELRREGRRLADYLRDRGMDAERWLRNEEIGARRDLERMLVLDEISRREGIEVTQQEISDELAGIAQRYGSSAERVRKSLRERGVDRLSDRLQRHKVLQFLVEHAEITSEGASGAEMTASEVADGGRGDQGDTVAGLPPAPQESQEEQP